MEGLDGDRISPISCPGLREGLRALIKPQQLLKFIYSLFFYDPQLKMVHPPSQHSLCSLLHRDMQGWEVPKSHLDQEHPNELLKSFHSWNKMDPWRGSCAAPGLLGSRSSEQAPSVGEEMILGLCGGGTSSWDAHELTFGLKEILNIQPENQTRPFPTFPV